MIKDVLINLFGSYTPIFSPVNLTLQSSDGASEILVTLQQAFINYIWFAKYFVFIFGLFLLFKLIVAAVAMIKR